MLCERIDEGVSLPWNTQVLDQVGAAPSGEAATPPLRRGLGATGSSSFCLWINIDGRFLERIYKSVGPSGSKHVYSIKPRIQLRRPGHSSREMDQGVEQQHTYGHENPNSNNHTKQQDRNRAITNPKTQVYTSPNTSVSQSHNNHITVPRTTNSTNPPLPHPSHSSHHSH
jgi:hypothetical protein